jgi:hypothetical protein
MRRCDYEAGTKFYSNLERFTTRGSMVWARTLTTVKARSQTKKPAKACPFDELRAASERVETGGA